MFRSRLGTLLLLAACALVLPACGSPHEPAIENQPPEYRAFGQLQRVSLRGYDDDAMEPFITRDGHYLLFNDRNDPRIDTRLHFAERIDDLNFDYRGEIGGANSPALEGVPSLDRHGNLFFVSTRSYPETLATLYQGRFDGGAGHRISAVPVILRAARPGVEVPFGAPERIASISGHVEAPALSNDGRSLYYHKLEEGRFVIYRVTR